MLERCDFMELTEEVLQQCNGFTCKDADITEFSPMTMPTTPISC